MKVAGDVWGGLATMLVVVPASLAFGVTVYAAIAPAYAGLGAVAGILGAVVLGLIAPVIGGTDRLITAPCAPATALLSAFAITLVVQGNVPEVVVLLMTLMVILAGLLQIVIGFTKVGNLIKYLPHTVVSGYMTAVGLIILFSQLPTFFGAPMGTKVWQVLFHPQSWAMPSLLVGLVTAVVMGFADRWIKLVPSTIIGIVAGVLTYWLLSLWLPELQHIESNPYVIGAMNISIDGYTDLLSERWVSIGQITLGQLAALLGSALTLAVLLSIDTLKTGIVVDQITHSRHEPNKELVAQGVANIAAAAVGGVPGSGTMGPTLVNVVSGAQTRYAAVIAGGLALLSLILLSGVLAWLPKATLAAVLIVIGIRMFDLKAFKLITSRATALDFMVVLSVILVALFYGLIWASATGVVMAIVLFLREQVGGSVLHRRSFLGQRSSTWYRSESEMKLLAQKADDAVICELQGSLFFGTARQLASVLEIDAANRRYVMIDFLRVTSIDVTAAHVLHQIYQVIKSHNGILLISSLRNRDQINVDSVLALIGHQAEASDLKLFDTLDVGIEWIENQLIGKNKEEDSTHAPIHLQEMDLFKDRKQETLSVLESMMEAKSFEKGQRIYDVGDDGHAMFLLRRGRVKIIAPIGGSRRLHHIATFGAGNFFGGLSFLDGHPRGDAAIADTDVDVFVLTSESFLELTEHHKRMAFLLMQSIAQTLGQRLRHTDGELTMLLE